MGCARFLKFADRAWDKSSEALLLAQSTHITALNSDEPSRLAKVDWLGRDPGLAQANRGPPPESATVSPECFPSRCDTSNRIHRQLHCAFASCHFHHSVFVALVGNRFSWTYARPVKRHSGHTTGFPLRSICPLASAPPGKLRRLTDQGKARVFLAEINHVTDTNQLMFG